MSHMTNIGATVTNFIDHDVSIRRGLARKYINVRSLARYIEKKLNLAATDAIISAIRRYDVKEQETQEIEQRYQELAQAKISARTRMMLIRMRKTEESRKAIAKAYQEIDFSSGYVLRILEGSHSITVIIDEQNTKYFEKVPSIETTRSLGEISLEYSGEVQGAFAALASELTLHKISIKEGILSGNEHIFIFAEQDTMRALNAINDVVRWAQ